MAQAIEADTSVRFGLVAGVVFHRNARPQGGYCERHSC